MPEDPLSAEPGGNPLPSPGDSGPSGARRAAGETIPVGGPTALPSVTARAVAFVAILVAGMCGALIGRSLVLVQCREGCATPAGLATVGGAVTAAGGVAVVAVLVLRAMGEWRAGPAARRRG